MYRLLHLNANQSYKVNVLFQITNIVQIYIAMRQKTEKKFLYRLK